MKDVVWAVLSGVLTALCLPKPGLCPLAWVSLAPLLAAAGAAGTVRRASSLGWLAGFTFHGVALYWVYFTCRFAGLGPWLAAAAWGGLAALLGLNWGLIAGLGRALGGARSAAVRPWSWAVVWTAVSWGFEGSPRLAADLLAYTQYKNLALVQIGSILGPHALGFLIVAANSFVVELSQGPPAGGRAAGGPLAVSRAAGGSSLPPGLAGTGAILIALITGAWMYGTVCLVRRTLAPAPETPARVWILQPAVDQYRKWDERFAREISEGFAALLSQPAERGPDLSVWPESSLPFMTAEGGEAPVASAWSRKLRAWQWVGAITEADGSIRNSVLRVAPTGRVEGAYHKRRLVPFGEFVPISFLRRYVGILNELGETESGAWRQNPAPTPLGPAAAQICYEATFPELARRDAAAGAALIINVTNDGWYKDTAGPIQHFYTNLFRAVENRVTVIRAANTGISGVIDPWGVVTARLGLGERGRLEADVDREPPFPRGSFYSRHGDSVGPASLLIVALLLARRRGAG